MEKVDVLNNQQEWQPLSLETLNEYDVSEDLYKQEQEDAEERRTIIQNTFDDFGLDVQVIDYVIGDAVTRYSLRCGHTTSLRSIVNTLTDVQIRMAGTPIRFEPIVMGQTLSALEIQNEHCKTVSFKEAMEALPNPIESPLEVPIGKSIDGKVLHTDLKKLPHILAVGTTGSGKSIFINSLITSLIMRNSPEELKLVLVDPKKVEFFRYEDMPHLLCPVLKEVDDTKRVLEKLAQEVDSRFKEFNKIGCANIDEYNEDASMYGLKKKPYIVVVIDEYADVVDQDRSVYIPVVSLAQKGRAAGIHLVIATQRCSTNVITGVLKSNIPTHITFMTPSIVDSMTIIGEGGAEKLIGKGDMLVQSPAISKVGLVRLQGCFIHRHEIKRVVDFLKEHYQTSYDQNLLSPSEVIKGESVIKESSLEEKYQSIKKWVLTQEYMSISRIQRECSVGFNRAGRIFLRLQADGVISDKSTKQGYLVNKI